MIETLFNQLQQFTIILDKSSQITSTIKECAENKEWDQIESLTANRERCLDIVAVAQERIEETIGQMTSQELSKDIIDIIKAWAHSTQTWINQTILADEYILETLESEKEQTTQEIAQIFRAKQAFKGYDLNDVTK